MQKIKNSKGFTLIELLVAISIMAIITVMALPSIRNLQDKNKNSKFVTYEKSILSGAKLYVDSYSEDMFDEQLEEGCYDIKYKELLASNLIKSYRINNITCEDDKTFVRVYKNKTKYKYEVSLYCKDAKGTYQYQKDLENNICTP